jgi:hypothetical protein
MSPDLAQAMFDLTARDPNGGTGFSFNAGWVTAEDRNDETYVLEPFRVEEGGSFWEASPEMGAHPDVIAVLGGVRSVSDPWRERFLFTDRWGTVTLGVHEAGYVGCSCRIWTFQGVEPEKRVPCSHINRFRRAGKASPDILTKDD